ITMGKLTNSGTLVMDPAPNNITRELKGGLANSGTWDMNGATAFDKGGASLTQTAGTTTIAPGVILDMSNSMSTFELQGGVLAGGGQTQAAEAVINGPVDNTGGNVIP